MQEAADAATKDTAAMAVKLTEKEEKLTELSSTLRAFKMQKKELEKINTETTEENFKLSLKVKNMTK